MYPGWVPVTSPTPFTWPPGRKAFRLQHRGGARRSPLPGWGNSGGWVTLGCCLPSCLAVVTLGCCLPSTRAMVTHLSTFLASLDLIHSGKVFQSPEGLHGSFPTKKSGTMALESTEVHRFSFLAGPWCVCLQDLRRWPLGPQSREPCSSQAPLAAAGQTLGLTSAGARPAAAQGQPGPGGDRAHGRGGWGMRCSSVGLGGQAQMATRVPAIPRVPHLVIRLRPRAPLGGKASHHDQALSQPPPRLPQTQEGKVYGRF